MRRDSLENLFERYVSERDENAIAELVHRTRPRLVATLTTGGPAEFFDLTGSVIALRNATYYRNQRMEIALEEGRTTRRALALEPAGRLRILVRDPEGRTNIAAAVDLRDAAGRAVDTSYAKYSGGMTNVSSGGLPPNVGPAEVTSPLLPGRYELRLTPFDSDLKPRTVTLDIEVGRTHVVEVDLHR